MKYKFDNISVQCSKLTTVTYSTSFSLGIKFLDKKFHAPIYSIYGFVRFADEIVDSFHDYPKKDLLMQFRQDTYAAIAQKISLNPILNSFQRVVHDYNIEMELIETFLDSMEMDLNQQSYDKALYDRYIVGSAEVVGLMCLRVFCENNHARFDDLKSAAMKLGSAFQKVNFLRDVKDDTEILGRTYFPGVDLHNFSISQKKKIETEIEDDFRLALEGLRKLPVSSRRGVYLAYYYYIVLFRKIKKMKPARIMRERIRIPNIQKIALMLTSSLKHQLNML